MRPVVLLLVAVVALSARALAVVGTGELVVTIRAEALGLGVAQVSQERFALVVTEERWSASQVRNEPNESLTRFVFDSPSGLTLIVRNYDGGRSGRGVRAREELPGGDPEPFVRLAGFDPYLRQRLGELEAEPAGQGRIRGQAVDIYVYSQDLETLDSSIAGVGTIETRAYLAQDSGLPLRLENQLNVALLGSLLALNFSADLTEFTPGNGVDQTALVVPAAATLTRDQVLAPGTPEYARSLPHLERREGSGMNGTLQADLVISGQVAGLTLSRRVQRVLLWDNLQRVERGRTITLRDTLGGTAINLDLDAQLLRPVRGETDLVIGGDLIFPGARVRLLALGAREQGSQRLLDLDTTIFELRQSELGTVRVFVAKELDTIVRLEGGGDIEDFQLPVQAELSDLRLNEPLDPALFTLPDWPLVTRVTLSPGDPRRSQSPFSQPPAR
ncbi:MAG: hypothetical protein HY335_10500 [Deinococcus sp.]|nr:hypothetical protein [Deinococcus sp.]